MAWAALGGNPGKQGKFPIVFLESTRPRTATFYCIEGSMLGLWSRRDLERQEATLRFTRKAGVIADFTALSLYGCPLERFPNGHAA
eukprot:8515322-Prorocentrum_lima.AAC.1